MKIQQHPQTISITIIDKIQLDVREAAFLREMAKFCVERRMAGSDACEALIATLDRLQVPTYSGGPVYDLFEDEP